jgi:hypothetical protein
LTAEADATQAAAAWCRGGRRPACSRQRRSPLQPANLGRGGSAGKIRGRRSVKTAATSPPARGSSLGDTRPGCCQWGSTAKAWGRAAVVLNLKPPSESGQGRVGDGQRRTRRPSGRAGTTRLRESTTCTAAASSTARPWPRPRPTYSASTRSIAHEPDAEYKARLQVDRHLPPTPPPPPSRQHVTAVTVFV